MMNEEDLFANKQRGGKPPRGKFLHAHYSSFFMPALRLKGKAVLVVLNASGPLFGGRSLQSLFVIAFATAPEIQPKMAPRTMDTISNSAGLAKPPPQRLSCAPACKV